MAHSLWPKADYKLTQVSKWLHFSRVSDVISCFNTIIKDKIENDHRAQKTSGHWKLSGWSGWSGSVWRLSIMSNCSVIHRIVLTARRCIKTRSSVLLTSESYPCLVLGPRTSLSWRSIVDLKTPSLHGMKSEFGTKNVNLKMSLGLPVISVFSLTFPFNV